MEAWDLNFVVLEQCWASGWVEESERKCGRVEGRNERDFKGHMVAIMWLREKNEIFTHKTVIVFIPSNNIVIRSKSVSKTVLEQFFSSDIFFSLNLKSYKSPIEK